MKSARIETAVGIFMLIGIACVGYLTIQLGKMEFMGSNHYPVFARFQDVSGLKPGAQVEMAGVEIGKVDNVSLDQEREVALVKLMIRNGIVLTDDSIASVKTSGLIGDKYIRISPGGSPEDLKPEGFITETESALDIEGLIGKYVFGGVKKEEEK